MRQPLRQPHPIRTGEIENFEDNAEYVGYIDGAGYVLKNGHTGLETTYTTAAEMIQAGLDATENGKFVLKGGKYVIDTKLTLANYGVEFCGNNMWHDSLGTADVAGIWLDDGVDDNMLDLDGRKCHLHDLNFNGNKANNTTSNGIEMTTDSALDPHLNNLYVFLCNDIGILWNGGAGVGIGVYVEYCNDSGFQFHTSGDRNCLVQCGSYLNKWGFDVRRMDNRFIGCISADNEEYGYILQGDTPDNCLFDGCVSMRDGHHGFWLYGASKTIISNCIIEQSSNDHDDTYNAIYMSTLGGPKYATYNVVSGNIITAPAGNKHKYGIAEEDANNDYNIITGNSIQDSQTANILHSGANSICKDNIGWKNEAHGVTGAVADGGTFAHGLASTALGCVVTGTVTGDIIKVTGLGAANVTVSIKDEGGGAGTAQVLYWKAWC